MKTKHFISAIAISLIAIGSSSAKVWRVNNDIEMLGGTGNKCSHCYTDLQEAIDYANSGDTLHVEASGTNYSIGNTYIVLNKKLTIIGPGYFLNENNHQNDQRSAMVNLLSIEEGASGSKIIGLDIDGPTNPYIKIYGQNIEDLVINHCRIDGYIYFSEIKKVIAYKNIEIRSNWIQRIDYGQNLSGTISGLTIANNYVEEAIYLSDKVSGSIYNNIIAICKVYNGLSVYNNIFTSTVTANNNSTTNFYNNIFTGASSSYKWLNGGSNFFGLSTSVIFKQGSTLKTEEKLEVNTSGTCSSCYKGYTGTGTNNGQIGMYGGTEPYQPGGAAPIPSISILKGQTLTFQGDSPTIEISTQSNK